MVDHETQVKQAKSLHGKYAEFLQVDEMVS